MNPLGDTVVLASASPRRRRLLAWLGIPYDAVSTDTDEDLTSPLASDPPALARSLAEEKAEAASEQGSDGLVLAFDTIVVLDGRVLGKPMDLDEARSMLRSLSGRSHEVVTGVAMRESGAERAAAFSVSTAVTMQVLDDAAIEAWVAEGELLGCAGAYNIERHLAHVALDQCFQNVAGLPLCHLYRELRDAGLAPAGGMLSPVPTCNAARDVRCELGPRVAGEA